LREPEAVAVASHPGLFATCANKAGDLASALNEPDTRSEAADHLRGLIEDVTLSADPEARSGHRIALSGELGTILSSCDSGCAPHAGARRDGAGVRQVIMVAGARNLRYLRLVERQIPKLAA